MKRFSGQTIFEKEINVFSMLAMERKKETEQQISKHLHHSITHNISNVNSLYPCVHACVQGFPFIFYLFTGQIHNFHGKSAILCAFLISTNV